MATAGWWAPGPVVGSGFYTTQLSAQRGLCKPEQCDLFDQLNPYQHYGNGWDELIRQGYPSATSRPGQPRAAPW